MNKWLIIVLIFFFCLSLRLWNLNQMGSTWDEVEYIKPGYEYIELLKKGDFDNSYFYTTYNHPPFVKYLYGITAHFDVERHVNGKPVFKYDLTYSRALSALIFSVGVVVVAMMGWNFFSPAVGIVCGLILTMLPFSLGLSQLVTAESFKIFIYPLTIYSYILLLQKYSLRKLIFAGVITGIALQIKQTNVLLIPIFGLMYFFYYKQKHVEKKMHFFNKRLFAVPMITILSIIVFILFWPQLLFHLNEVYNIHQRLWHVQFSPKIWQITLSPPEVFFGRLMLTPVFYYVVYFFITIPIIILGLFFLGLNKIYKTKDWISYTIILWFVLPFALSFYSWRQHGLRYIIEIYPAIALIAAIGFDSVVRKFTTITHFKLVLFLPIMFYLSIQILQIKPYYLDYFNELVGGVNTVYKYKLFQIGWWGQGVREAGLYVIKNAPEGSSVGLALSPIHVSPPMLKLNVQKYENHKNYDYVIVNYYNVLREGFNDSFIRSNYKPIYFVKADGAVLAIVYKRK